MPSDVRKHKHLWRVVRRPDSVAARLRGGDPACRRASALGFDRSRSREKGGPGSRPSRLPVLVTISRLRGEGGGGSQMKRLVLAAACLACAAFVSTAVALADVKVTDQAYVRHD